MADFIFPKGISLSNFLVAKEWRWNPRNWSWWTEQMPVHTAIGGIAVEGVVVTAARGPYLSTRVYYAST